MHHISGSWQFGLNLNILQTQGPELPKMVPAGIEPATLALLAPRSTD